MEHAPGWRVERAGHISGQNDPLPLGLDDRVRNGHRREQRLGIRMQRVLVKLCPIRYLHHMAQIHHRDPVADVAHHRQVMRNEQIRKVELLLKLL